MVKRQTRRPSGAACLASVCGNSAVNSDPRLRRAPETAAQDEPDVQSPQFSGLKFVIHKAET